MTTSITPMSYAKQKNKIVTAFIWLSLLLVGSCTYEPCICSSYSDISIEMKDFVKFKKGDYWAFQMLEDTTIVDTLKCVSLQSLNNRCDEGYISGNANPCSKIYRLKLAHSNSTIYPGYGVGSNNKGFEEVEIEQIGRSETYSINRNFKGAVTVDFHFVLPEISPDSLFSGGNNYVASFIDKYVVRDSNFTNVVFSRLTIPPKEGHFIDSIYIVPNIGIVGYKNGLKQTWQLMSYHIQP